MEKRRIIDAEFEVISGPDPAAEREALFQTRLAQVRAELKAERDARMRRPLWSRVLARHGWAVEWRFVRLYVPTMAVFYALMCAVGVVWTPLHEAHLREQAAAGALPIPTPILMTPVALRYRAHQ